MGIPHAALVQQKVTLRGRYRASAGAPDAISSEASAAAGYRERPS